MDFNNFSNSQEGNELPDLNKEEQETVTPTTTGETAEKPRNFQPRISFTMSEGAYKVLQEKIGDADPNATVKALLYSHLEIPVELSYREEQKLLRANRRRDELEAKLKALEEAQKNIPPNPFKN